MPEVGARPQSDACAPSGCLQDVWLTHKPDAGSFGLCACSTYRSGSLHRGSTRNFSSPVSNSAPTTNETQSTAEGQTTSCYTRRQHALDGCTVTLSKRRPRVTRRSVGKMHRTTSCFLSSTLRTCFGRRGSAARCLQDAVKLRDACKFRKNATSRCKFQHIIAPCAA